MIAFNLYIVIDKCEIEQSCVIDSNPVYLSSF